MFSAVGPPQQHKQPSRKGKRAWRKNVDISAVQTGLESLREEIRQGGPITEKPSEELFVVDTAGSEEIRKKHRLHKPLKVDQILAERSAVPAVDARKRPHSRVGNGIREPDSKRQRKEWVSKKEVAKLRENINKTSLLDGEHLDDDGGASFDLWDEKPVQKPITRQDEYIPESQPIVAPSTIRRAPTALTASGKAVKAISDPDAGTSYNPAFEDWDDLLNREGAKEVEAALIRQAQAQEQAEREARISAIAAADDREAQSDYESAWEGFSEPDQATLKQRRPERKTPAQRNKIKRRQKESQLERHRQATGRKEKLDAERVLALVKASKQAEIVPFIADETTTDDNDAALLRRRKLGNAIIPAQPLELVLPDELQESLRRLKPEGNLLGDRFRNLLVNGKIESRRPVPVRRQRKVKMTEKWSYKDFGVPV